MIEYRGLILAEKELGSSKPTYWMFSQQCENHIREPDWTLITKGWEYSILAEICERAGQMVAGGIQIGDGSGHPQIFTPEEYLARWRKLIADAKPFDKLLDLIRISRGWLILEQEAKLISILNSNEHYQVEYNKMLEIFRLDGSWMEHPRVVMSIEHPDDFRIWHEYACFDWVHKYGFG